MQAPVTLPYARRSRRWTRKRKLAVILLAVVTPSLTYLGYQAYKNLRARTELLNKDPRLGPVDWAAVVTSPTLCKLAWELSSDRTAIQRFARDPNGVGGVTLFGVNPEDLEVDLRFPLEYADGQLTLCITVQNRSAKRVLIPPFGQFASQILQYHSYRVPRDGQQSDMIPVLRDAGIWNAEPLPRSQRSSGAEFDPLAEPPSDAEDLQTLYVILAGCSARLSWLGSGVCVLGAGETKTIELSISAPPRPGHVWLSVHPPGHKMIGFEVGALTTLLHAYDAWEAVPRSELRREWREPKTTLFRNLFEDNLLPPMLFPDEAEPKPWEPRYLP